MTIRMTRIERPLWASVPTIRQKGMSAAEYEAIQTRRGQLLEVVQREVERYLNIPELVFESDAEGFPNINRLTGTYYTGDESYRATAESSRIAVSITARCLEKPWLEDQENLDYLALEVWLECHLPEFRFFSDGDVNASVI